MQSVQLNIGAPPELAAVRSRLESIDPARFANIAQLVGLSDAGLAIRIVLVPESSNVARNVPQWIVGYTVKDSVALFPSRSPGYPNDSLEDVMRHEVAHALIWRKTGGQAVPRWFNEGLAMSVERERRFEDQTQLFYQLVSGPRTNLDELDRLFGGSQGDQIRAYALAGALVSDVLERNGPMSCAQILTRIAGGATFDAAFADVTKMPPADVEAEFWQHQRIWTNWVPVLTSTTTLWLVVTLLAILAIVRRRQKNREIEKHWEEEDGPDDNDT